MLILRNAPVLTLVLLVLILPSCTTTSATDSGDNLNFPPASLEKQRGAHVFGYLDSTNVKPFQDCNIEWISMVSWASQRDIDSPDLGFRRMRKDTADLRDSTWSAQMQIAHDAGFKLCFKPHVWLNEPSDGAWRNKIFPASDSAWKQWSSSYREFILQEAALAERNGVELFCIGTELTRLSTEKPAFWRALIAEVREVYAGELTYAANWYAEYQNIPFWDALDYIGIQAYFPLVDHDNPSEEEVRQGWEQYMKDMEAISTQFNRPILFTEMGYKSTPDAAARPWEWVEHGYDENSPISNETQAICYSAFFETVWSNDWFAGVHIWQVRPDNLEPSGMCKQDFTPFGKTAEDVIRRGFNENIYHKR